MAEIIRKQEDLNHKQLEAGPRAIKDLNKVLADLRREYDSLHNAGLPIFTLPNEVLEEVFQCAADMTRDEPTWDPNLGDLTKALTEIRITHVCSQFRKIALRLSSLWAFFSNVGRGKEDTAKRFKLYLQRSKSHPLELWIDFRNQTSVPRDLLRLAVEHVERWQYITILYNENAVGASKIQQWLGGSKAPLLEHLDLGLHGGHPSGWTKHEQETRCSDTAPSILEGGCPRLTSLRLGAFFASKLLPPISTVTHLSIEFSFTYMGPRQFQPPIPWDVFTKILKLPLLSFSIDDGCIRGNPAAQTSAITLPHLKHLRLGRTRSLGFQPISVLISQFLVNLVAPALESLTFDRICICLPFDPEQPVPMSFPQLHSVYALPHLRNWGEEVAWLRVLSEASPAVRSFSGTFTPEHHSRGESEREVGCLLDASSPHGMIWPTLEKLAVLHPVEDAGKLEEFVKLRSTPDRRFTLKVPLDDACCWNSPTCSTGYHKYEVLFNLGELSPWDSTDEVFPRAMWPPGENLIRRPKFAKSFLEGRF
ncbi:hypothetical protein CC1G_09197 [Coprinopsis cinerea okayama7|uniref:F-box domain-containing protein n=1 Tax=Coprinopsis cinerea (strain Okayama-7 / 130 / ATCC MYA-4618 / FGSC 9003) TaxID=240176 RepID=A8P9X5_COPC7|nr:hypothetical protein CC1G_09197 [Coprinopsis cinerea okayama7\|eukprot:XP_001839863.2 hypothetical protein CC1G_09197 [Coprinopsis cinerea okayama7\